MNTHHTIRRIALATMVAGALGLTSLAGGAASADSPPLLYSALTRNEAPQAGDDRPTEEVAFYYNRIAFNYAASK